MTATGKIWPKPDWSKGVIAGRPMTTLVDLDSPLAHVIETLGSPGKLKFAAPDPSRADSLTLLFENLNLCKKVLAAIARRRKTGELWFDRLPGGRSKAGRTSIALAVDILVHLNFEAPLGEGRRIASPLLSDLGIWADVDTGEVLGGTFRITDTATLPEVLAAIDRAWETRRPSEPTA